MCSYLNFIKKVSYETANQFNVRFGVIVITVWVFVSSRYEELKPRVYKLSPASISKTVFFIRIVDIQCRYRLEVFVLGTFNTIVYFAKTVFIYLAKKSSSKFRHRFLQIGRSSKR